MTHNHNQTFSFSSKRSPSANRSNKLNKKEKTEEKKTLIKEVDLPKKKEI